MNLYIQSRATTNHRCPRCKIELNGITGIADRPEDTIPVIGGLSLCICCGAALVILENGYRLATETEWNEIEATLRNKLAAFCQEQLGHGIVMETSNGNNQHNQG